jgi:hypothetical protein
MRAESSGLNHLLKPPPPNIISLATNFPNMKLMWKRIKTIAKFLPNWLKKKSNGKGKLHYYLQAELSF